MSACATCKGKGTFGAFEVPCPGCRGEEFDAQRPAPLTGAQLAAKHGFRPHGKTPAEQIQGVTPYARMLETQLAEARAEIGLLHGRLRRAGLALEEEIHGNRPIWIAYATGDEGEKT